MKAAFTETRRWKFVLVFFLILLSLPLLAILLEVRSGFFHELVRGLTSTYSLNSITLIVMVAFFSLLMGVLPAWFISRYRFPFSRILGWALALPLAIPAYIMAYVYKGIFGLYGTTHALIDWYFEVDNIWMLSLIMAVSLYPYVYLASRTAFRMSSQKFNEVSQSLGSGIWRTFLRIQIPLAWPAIVAGLSLVIMEVLNNYGAVKYFGINTFTTEIVRLWNPMDKLPVYNISAVLILLVAVLFLLEYVVRSRARFIDKSPGTDLKQLQTKKGTGKWGTTLLVSLPLLIGFFIPMLQLLVWAFAKWKMILDGEIWSAFSTSLLLGLAAGVLTVSLAFPVRFFQYHWPSRGLGFLDRMATMGYAVPGVLVGVGMLSILTYLIHWTGLHLTTSIFVLMFAYVVRFYAVANNGIESGLVKISPNLGYSSLVLGANLWWTMRKIHLPLLQKAFWVSVILVFVDCLKELPLTMMFQQFNFNTLAVEAFTLMEIDGAVYDASLPSLLIVGLSIIPVVLVDRLLQK